MQLTKNDFLPFGRNYEIQSSSLLGSDLASWIYHLLFFSTCNQEAVTQFTGPGGAIPGGSRRLPGIKDMDTLVELWRNIHCL